MISKGFIREYLGSWCNVLDLDEMIKIMGFLDMEYIRKPICPNKGDVFKAFELCPYEEVKVVFIGQDPYPQPNVATGILFGNSKETPEEKLSPSLKIVKDAVIDLEIPHNSIIFDQTLESWAKQGILMINSALTVEANKVGSHAQLWRKFMTSFISNLSDKSTGIVYVLFGKDAQTLEPYIHKETNYIIKCNHPAYHARLNTKMDSSIFKKINKLMMYMYNNKIKFYEELD